MIIETNLPKNKGSHKKIKIKCDECELEFLRAYRDIFRAREKHRIVGDVDNCWQCAFTKSVTSEEHRKRMSIALIKTHRDHPEFAKQISVTLKANNVNVGDKNGMKKLENREKVSKTRKKMFIEHPEMRADISKCMCELWANGVFKDVKVGKSKWYDFIKQDGTTIKCQGTWELAFAKWADENNLTFETHRGRIKYCDENGAKRSYYPDFYIEDWKCYIDVKSDYFYNLNKNKFDCIRKSNKKLNLKILFREDLLKLGVIIK